MLRNVSYPYSTSRQMGKEDDKKENKSATNLFSLVLLIRQYNGRDMKYSSEFVK